MENTKEKSIQDPKIYTLSGFANHITISDKEMREIISLADLKVKVGYEIKSLKDLKRLDLRNNQLTELTGLSKLTKLEYLNLRNNQLTELPDLSNLTTLEYLGLTGNQLTQSSQT